MKKALTIEDLKARIGKPVFTIATTGDFKNKWRVVFKIKEVKADNQNHGYIEFTDCNCINFENLKIFRFFDEEVTFKELKEILDAEEKAKKKTGYERVKSGQNYWDTRVVKYLDDDNFCNSLYLVGDYVNDEILAKNIARAERLKHQLRRYAALNGGILSPVDWQNIEIEKYFINYLYHIKSIKSDVTRGYRGFEQIYFKNKEACEKAMEIFKDELMWYFTEFEEQLY